MLYLDSHQHTNIKKPKCKTSNPSVMAIEVYSGLTFKKGLADQLQGAQLRASSCTTIGSTTAFKPRWGFFQITLANNWVWHISQIQAIPPHKGLFYEQFL